MKSLEFSQLGLVGHWKFSEGIGAVAKDSSPEGNHGTIEGATWTNDTERRMGLLFDGVDDYVDCGNDASLNFDSNSAITIEEWIKVDGLSGILFGKWGANTGYLFALSSGKLIWYCDATNRETSSACITTDSWIHIAVTWDGSGDDKARFYVDGILKETSTAISTLTTNNVNAVISSKMGGSIPINGTIDSVRIYNRALSAAEVLAHYSRKKHLMDNQNGC